MPRPIQRRLPFVAIFLSFRVIRGAVIRPPPRAKVAQTPGRARVKAVSTGPVTSWNFNTAYLSIATTKEKRLRMKFIYGDSLRRHLCCGKRRIYRPEFFMPNFTPCSESSHAEKFIYRMVPIWIMEIGPGVREIILRRWISRQLSLEGSMPRWFGQYCYKKAITSCKNVPWLKLSWSEPPPGSSFSATHDWNWYWAYYQAASRVLRSIGGTLAPERSHSRIAARSGTNGPPRISYSDGGKWCRGRNYIGYPSILFTQMDIYELQC